MSWKWNEKAARYMWVNGKTRFLSRAQVMSWVDASLRASTQATSTLAQLAHDKMLSPADWQTAMRREIKDEYIRQYLLGRGGRDQMTSKDWGKLGAMLKEQYKYLDGFQADVAAGNLTQDQIRARSEMYVNSAREAYERTQGAVAERWGADQERWVIDPTAENCGDCIAYQAEGWQAIGYFPFPGDGSTQCLTNCRCHKEYRISESDTMFGAEA